MGRRARALLFFAPGALLLLRAETCAPPPSVFREFTAAVRGAAPIVLAPGATSASARVRVELSPLGPGNEPPRFWVSVALDATPVDPAAPGGAVFASVAVGDGPSTSERLTVPAPSRVELRTWGAFGCRPGAPCVERVTVTVARDPAAPGALPPGAGVRVRWSADVTARVYETDGGRPPPAPVTLTAAAE